MPFFKSMSLMDHYSYISAHRGLRERLSSLYAAAWEKKEGCGCEDKPSLGKWRNA